MAQALTPTTTAQAPALRSLPGNLSVLSVAPKTRGRGGVPLTESVKSSLYSLSANVMRTALTMLGIIIGVGAVVALLAIGNGVVADARATVERNGTDLITIQGANQISAGVATGNTQNTLTVDDAIALAEPGAVPDAAAVSPEAFRGGRITFGALNTFGGFRGVWPTFTTLHNYNPVIGEWFSDADVSSGATVVALGSTIATALFQGDNPVGKSMRLNGVAFRVVAAMETKGGNGFGSLDSQVYIPLTTALTRLVGGTPPGIPASGKVVNTIYIKATDSSTVNKAINEANEVLAARHRTRTGAPDWQVTNQADQIQAAEETQRTYQIFLLVIASISLLVGGIGIMNIMLVSVTERTREIGIRKAIGAREKDIMTQFITEAVLISLLGALTGVVFGLAASYIVGKTWERTIVSPGSIVIAVAFATATGLFFGVYPARRASRLKPIEALRYE
jgi:putative ABC transport system permease protein